jgi:serine/threonine-protein kinase
MPDRRAQSQGQTLFCARGMGMSDEPLRSTLRLPLNLSHYRLERRLGAGGMGEVYLAIDRRSRERVVVKLLHEHLEQVSQFQERFEREAHVAALLRSPYTVHLLDYGYERGRYFLVMDYVDGQTLRDALHDGPMQAVRALKIAAQVARALEEAQARGVVHRDIKPENIMLSTNDAVKVLDFGIARQAGASSLTLPGVFVGTAAYAAPETARGEADGRSDIYSLGATLYHTLAGRPPFTGELGQVLRGHMEQPVPFEPIAYLPPPVLAVIERCLAKRPEDRFQTATELAAALEQAAMYLTGGQAVAAATVVDPYLQPPAPPPASWPATGAAAASWPAPGQDQAATWAVSPAGPSGQASWPGTGTWAQSPVELELRESRARRGGTSYDLVIRNSGEIPANVAVHASDPGARCNFTVPPVVAVPALGSVTVPVEVRSRRRRLGGSPEQIAFTVQGDSGGLPPASATALFRDSPMGKGFFIIGSAVVGLLGATAAAVAFSAGGGDDPGPGPGPDDESQTAEVSPEDEDTPEDKDTPEDEATPTPTEGGAVAPTDTPTSRPADTATPTPTPTPTPTATSPPPLYQDFHIVNWCAYNDDEVATCVDDGGSIDASAVFCDPLRIEVNVSFSGLRVPARIDAAWYDDGSHVGTFGYDETVADSTAWSRLERPLTMGTYEVDWFINDEFVVTGSMTFVCN